MDIMNADQFNIQDLEERIAELEDEIDTFFDDNEEIQEELDTLVRFRDEVGDCEDFINDDYFEEYAENMAEELGLTQSSDTWPFTCIDWERAATELQQDYTSYELGDTTYWGR